MLKFIRIASLIMAVVLGTSIAIASSTYTTSNLSAQANSTSTKKSPAAQTLAAMTGEEATPDVIELYVDSDSISIENYAEDYLEIVDEMQERDLVALGGSLVYQTEYAFFDGQGRYYTPLAVQHPHTNILIGAELEFHVANDSELAACSILFRNEQNSDGSTFDYTQVGFLSNGFPFFSDNYSRSADPFYDLGFVHHDLKESHHLIISVYKNFLNVYIDGELVLETDGLRMREGSYGIALRTDTYGSRCAAHNLWIYELDTVWNGRTGYCGIVSENTVNLRSGPSVTETIQGQLEPDQVHNVNGQVLGADNYIWWNLTTDEWVRSDVVRELGDCETLAPQIDNETN